MLEYEVVLRLSIFFIILALVGLWEIARPKRKLTIKKNIRWMRNISLIFIDNITVKLVVPFTAVGVALYVEQHQIGLLYYFTIPSLAIFIISILLLDLIIYAQHIAFHYVPWLWRLHKIHHIDQDIDVTTGVRFHPLEILLSTLIKCAVVLALGISPIAVMLFEVILNGTSLFNHGNINLPKKLDQWLRLIVVTPDMHRIHHSVKSKETNSNFGFNFPWWDRLFRTYQAQPINGHIKMKIGLNEYQDARKTRLLALLLIPFRHSPER